MSNLYPLDAEYIEVAFNARPGADRPVEVGHRLRRPTLLELQTREHETSLEIVETNAREEQIVTDDETANVNLWNKLILSINGYRGISDWKPISDQEKALMRPSHKTKAIQAMYLGTASVMAEEDEISLGSDTWIIRHLIGPNPEMPAYEIRHVLREPTETERLKYKRSASKVSFIRGAKRPRTKITQDLNAYVQIYDQLIQEMHGVTVQDKEWGQLDKSAFVAHLDPIWKRMVVLTLMNAIEAALLD